MIPPALPVHRQVFRALLVLSHLASVFHHHHCPLRLQRVTKATGRIRGSVVVMIVVMIVVAVVLLAMRAWTSSLFYVEPS